MLLPPSNTSSSLHVHWLLTVRHLARHACFIYYCQMLTILTIVLSKLKKNNCSVYHQITIDCYPSWFLAERCYCITKFGYCHLRCCLSSVCDESTVAKMAKLGSRGFHWEVAKCLNINHGAFDDVIPKDPLNRRVQSRVGWFANSWGCISETVRDKA